MLRLVLFIGVLLYNPLTHAFSYVSYPRVQGDFKEEIVEHSYYTLGYSEEHEQARWVSYELNRDHLRHCTKRKNDFRPDPEVSTGSAESNDYRRSGFSRGHLVPAGDRLFNHHAMSETFYFSNMSPQPSSFNSGIWNQLELLARAWAIHHGSLHIITGPVLSEGLKKIGGNKVSVPKWFYKVILRETSNGNKYATAFLMPTDRPHWEVVDYAVSINELEEIIELDLFEGVLTEAEEDQVDTSGWDFDARYQLLPCR